MRCAEYSVSGDRDAPETQVNTVTTLLYFNSSPAMIIVDKGSRIQKFFISTKRYVTAKYHSSLNCRFAPNA